MTERKSQYPFEKKYGLMFEKFKFVELIIAYFTKYCYTTFDKNKKPTQIMGGLLLAETVGFACIFARGENKCSAPSSRRRRRSSAPHLIFRIPFLINKKPTQIMGGLFIGGDGGIRTHVPLPAN